MTATESAFARIWLEQVPLVADVVVVRSRRASNARSGALMRDALASGYERHEVLHMLASVVSDDVSQILHDQQSPDPDKTKAALGALRDSWERQRDELPAQLHANRAERRAAARVQRHRR
jgi:hypothetical protein